MARPGSGRAEQWDTWAVGNGGIPGRVYDVVIVEGPAGLGAATWLARYRRSMLVIDNHEYRNRWVMQSHGYLASNPANPLALLATARTQVNRYPIITFYDEATTARREHQGRFVVGGGTRSSSACA